MADVPTPEQLLHDLAWLRRLATTLAHDRDDADDLAQDAWIAAWQRQPDATRPLRGWLAKVVRDLANMKRRGDRRRTARHALADEPQAAPPPDEQLARLRLHRTLVELVLDLDEPYRSTIIARFVEGRSAAAIAASLGIPAGTVRKRLHEALARLRAALGQDRKRWAPVALGGIYVGKSTKLVVVAIAALLIATAATVVVVLAPRTEPAPDARSFDASLATPRVSPDARPPMPMPMLAEHRAADRAAMLAAITQAREARSRRTPATTTPQTTPTAGAASTGTTLDIEDRTGDTSAWQQRALATLNKLLGECYDLGRAEDPDLEGTIAIRFTVVGEPEVGGLLEQVEIIDANTSLAQQTLRDCMTQQLYALELDPPPEGVVVARELSLRFP